MGVAPVVFFVTSKELLEQSKEKLELALKLTDKIGVIGDGQCVIHDINVCTIQTCVSAFGREAEYKQSIKDVEDLEDSSEEPVAPDKYEQIRNLIRTAKTDYFR
jgi:superfamily II DNA or RNA helicase